MACKQIEREVFPSREFVERSRDFVWLEVQRFAGRSEPSETAIRYGVMAYPQFIVTDAEGHEVARGDVREGRGFFDRARAAWKSHRPAPAPPVSPRLKRLLDPPSAQAAAAEVAAAPPAVRDSMAGEIAALPDGFDRYRAARALRSAGAWRELGERLIADRNDYVRFEGLGMLAESADPAALGALLDLLDSVDRAGPGLANPNNVRCQAVETIEKLLTAAGERARKAPADIRKRTLEQLGGILERETANNAATAFAVRALARAARAFEDPGALAALAKALETGGDEPLRRSLARSARAQLAELTGLPADGVDDLRRLSETGRWTFDREAGKFVRR